MEGLQSVCLCMCVYRVICPGRGGGVEVQVLFMHLKDVMSFKSSKSY